MIQRHTYLLSIYQLYVCVYVMYVCVGTGRTSPWSWALPVARQSSSDSTGVGRSVVLPSVSRSVSKNTTQKSGKDGWMNGWMNELLACLRDCMLACSVASPSFGDKKCGSWFAYLLACLFTCFLICLLACNFDERDWKTWPRNAPAPKVSMRRPV